MRSSLSFPTAVALFAGGATACASLTGLDQITELACAPHCGEDEGGASEAGPPELVDATADALPRASSTPDASEEPTSWVDRLAPEAGEPDTPAQDAGDASEGHDANPTSDAGSRPDGATTPEASTATDAGACGTVFFHDAFSDGTKGWTLDTTWSIAPTCSNPPQPAKGNADPTVDHTTGSAGGVMGAYVCGNNPTGQTAPVRYATSPVVDVASAKSVFLGFYRWLDSDASGWMTSTVDVFDGTAWVNLYTNPSGAGNIVSDGAWTRESYDVTAYKGPAFQVRFGYALVNANVYAMSCWNVDDVTLSTVACP